MRGNSPNQAQVNMFGDLKTLCNPNESLIKLAEKIPWEKIEETFSEHYSHTGRPSKPVRLMVSLLILKQLYNKGDETVVEEWLQNPYWQYFSGEEYFQWKYPIEPTDLVHFRKRIGKEGVQKILELSVNLFESKKKEKEIVIDTTVQEKNITYPTDVKLAKKIIDKCNAIAKKEGIQQRQSYRRTVKELVLSQRFRKHPKKIKQAKAAERKLKTIAGRLIRELERKLEAESIGEYLKDIEIYKKVLDQKRNDKEKIYSLHELEVSCIAKGKEHKQYEFGSKAAIAITKNSGIIVGTASFSKNIYDGKTLETIIKQIEITTGKKPEAAIVDRGFRGKKQVSGVEIILPNRSRKETTNYQKTKARERFRRRASIEPIIGHMKSDFRLGRNFLKGSLGDEINLALSAAAFNFKKYINEIKKILSICESYFWQIRYNFL